MKHTRNIAFSVMIAAAITGCQNKSEKTTSDTDTTAASGTVSQPPVASDVTGTYVADSYQQRNEGYDWVGVNVRFWKDKEILLSVRSRADKKKPTCTADMHAFLKEGNTYSTVLEGKNIVIRFTADSLIIAPENKADEAALAFFCSGGATLAGTYRKINEPLDPAQVDKTQFIKVLRLQDIGFNVSSQKNDAESEITVFTFGTAVKKYDPFKQPFDGYVMDAEAEDLNADGNPDLLIYTQSEGTGRFGHVYGFSAGKTGGLSRIDFPKVNGNPKIDKGYGGHDSFSIVENNLVHRFPIYKEGDANAKATGGTREIVYKMVKGENAFKLEIVKITDQP